MSLANGVAGAILPQETIRRGGGLITIVMSTVIGADRARVWRALTDPSQVTAWDASVVAPIDVPSDYPKPGQHVRWRARMNGLPIVLHDRPIEVIGAERLRSSIAMGLFRFDETYTLADDPSGPGRTRLTMKVITSNEIPVVGGALDRFSVRQQATELVSASLQAIRTWCERGGAEAGASHTPS